MKLAIVGTGHVGLVTGACFAEVGHDVVCQDVDAAKIKLLQEGRLPIHEPGLPELFKATTESGKLTFTTSLADVVRDCEILFVCVGTPAGRRGESDMKYVEAVARDIAQGLQPGQYRLVVDKSTVPVKTAERVGQTMALYAAPGAEYGVASNPEFLREGAAVPDTQKPDRIVVGTASDKDRELLNRAYKPFIDIGVPYIDTNVRSAELIKHVANSFLSMKLSFINMVAKVCDAADADVDDICRGIGYDERIGTSFLRPGIGYGGYCFPKDVPAFANIAEELGVDASLLWSVHETNEMQPEWFYERIAEALWILEGKRIAVWGLAFKQDTDDCRQSPSIRLIRLLLDAGATVIATDPEAMEKAKRLLQNEAGELPERLHLHHDPIDCCDDADALVIGTEWQHYREIAPAAVKERMRLPLIFDGKNSLTPQTWRDAGFRYQGVGRPHRNA